MHRYLLTLLLLFAGVGAWAQDSAPKDEAESPESRETRLKDRPKERPEGNYFSVFPCAIVISVYFL